MKRTGHFRSRDGQDLYERHWEPYDQPQASMVLLHGYGEHCGRYEHVARALNAIGLAVYAYDQRGHGQSPGKRGYIRNFDALVDDLECYLGHLHATLSATPYFIMGHSMGGLVLARYAETRKTDACGLVFSSPFLQVHEDVSKLLIALAGILGRITPWLPVADLDVSAVSRDPKIVQSYQEDPLNFHGRILARTGWQLNSAIARARCRFQSITPPVYITHGSADRLVPADGSRLLYQTCRSHDKTLRIYEGGYHELFNDLEKETFLSELCAWINTHL